MDLEKLTQQAACATIVAEEIARIIDRVRNA